MIQKMLLKILIQSLLFYLSMCELPECYSPKSLETELFPGDWVNGVGQSWYDEIVQKDTFYDRTDEVYFNTTRWKQLSNNLDQKLLFQPKNCILQPLFLNETIDFLIKNDISIFLIGDSLTFFFALWMRSVLVEDPYTLCDANKTNKTKNFSCKLSHQSETRLVHLSSRFAEPPNFFDRFFYNMKAKRTDIAIFNFGSHYNGHGNPDKRSIEEELARMLLNYPSGWPRLIWREKLRHHFDSPTGEIINFPNFTQTCFPNKERNKFQEISRLNRIWSKHVSPAIILKADFVSMDRFNEHVPRYGLKYRSELYGVQKNYSEADCCHFPPASSMNRALGQMTFNLIKVINDNNIFTKPKK